MTKFSIVIPLLYHNTKLTTYYFEGYTRNKNLTLITFSKWGSFLCGRILFRLFCRNPFSLGSSSIKFELDRLMGFVFGRVPDRVGGRDRTRGRIQASDLIIWAAFSV